MPALPSFISVVPISDKFRREDVMWAVGALNKQIIRDFGPIWGVTASVDIAPSLDRVTPGKWKIALVDDISVDGLSAFHGWVGTMPYALVEYSKTWTISLSHECLEMLSDPFGQRLVPGQSIEDSSKRVEYLVEVCDPCQSDQFAYRVDGVLMSDFYTPNYFDPVFSPGVRYSFNTGSSDGLDALNASIPRPRNVPKGGYLTWHDPSTGKWSQYDNMGASPRIREVPPPAGVLARKAVDRFTRKRDREFWKKRHAKLPADFDAFDRSFFNDSAGYSTELMKRLRLKKRGRRVS
jgi:hypothetical protein